MARAYTVATAALALNTTPKWVDNVLSHFTISGVDQARQGVRRRITLDGLLILWIANEIAQNLGTPLRVGIPVAETIARTGSFQVSAHTVITVDRGQVREHLGAQLARAVEVAPVPRRGRPPKQTGRLS
jgi:hypothetical protein